MVVTIGLGAGAFWAAAGAAATKLAAAARDSMKRRMPRPVPALAERTMRTPFSSPS